MTPSREWNVEAGPPRPQPGDRRWESLGEREGRKSSSSSSVTERGSKEIRNKAAQSYYHSHESLKQFNLRGTESCTEKRKGCIRL